jgi:Membrane domain of glycerophosphoryl diester phosphodiesterase
MNGGGGAFGIGQVLTTSYSVVIRHFFLFFALAFAANVPNLVIDLMAPPEAPQWINTVAPDVEAATVDPALHMISPWILFPLIVGGLLLSFVLSAASTYLMIADLRGTPFSLAEALAGGIRALLPLLGVLVLLFLMLTGFAIVIGLVWGALAYGIFNDPKSPFGILVGLLFIVPVLVVALRLSLTVPVIVVERVGAVDSMKRSAELTKGSIWRMLGLFVVVGLIVVLVNAVFFGCVAAMFGLKAFFAPAGILARHVILSAEVPFYWAVVAALYYYLRTVAESRGAMPT